jgi:hypothetical protein
MRTRIIFIVSLLFVVVCFNSSQAYESHSGPSQLIQYNAAKAYEGYTLFSPMYSDKTYLIDMLGNVVHVWVHKDDTPLCIIFSGKMAIF